MAETDSTREAIARRLRAAREQAGLSQGQVARLLDYQRPTISEIEAGRRKVSAEELARFADLYKVSVSWLTLSKSEIPEPNVELAARELAKLKKEDLDRILQLLRTLRKAGRRLPHRPQDRCAVRRIQPRDRVAIVAMAQAGRLYREIAAQTGWSEPAVRKVLRQAGIRRYGLSKPEVAAAHAEGLTVAQIAKRLGNTHKAIYQALRKLGLRPHDGRNGNPGKAKRTRAPHATPLGRRLRELRGGVTARRLALLAGVDRHAYHGLEEGHRRPRPEWLARLEKHHRLRSGALAALVPADGWAGPARRYKVSTVDPLEEALRG